MMSSPSLLTNHLERIIVSPPKVRTRSPEWNPFGLRSGARELLHPRAEHGVLSTYPVSRENINKLCRTSTRTPQREKQLRTTLGDNLYSETNLCEQWINQGSRSRLLERAVGYDAATRLLPWPSRK